VGCGVWGCWLFELRTNKRPQHMLSVCALSTELKYFSFFVEESTHARHTQQKQGCLLCDCLDGNELALARFVPCELHHAVNQRKQGVVLSHSHVL